VLDYLGVDGRARVWAMLDEAAAERPLVFVANAPAGDGARTYQALVARFYPGGEPEELALADFHGAWIDWQAP
jgi:hypothetical protein